MQSTVETAPNEAIHLCWKQSLINSVYLLFNVQFIFVWHGLSREPQPESIYCFPSSWPRAKPRTLLRLFIYLGFLDQFPKIVSTLHGFHNLFIGFFLRDSDWDLINLAMIFNVWDLFEGVPGHDCLFGVPPIIRIILLRLLFFQSNLHVRGFSSQRIT